MSKLFSRIGQTKTPMAISLQFLEMTSNLNVSEGFYVVWKRGP